MTGSGDAVTEHFIVGGCIMVLRTWRFITLILAALTMGTAYAHALELPAKMKSEGKLVKQQYRQSTTSEFSHSKFLGLSCWFATPASNQDTYILF
ncbi:hypothetical protein [Leptolyngbya sp. 7M]|uniref:hypothetical protein n=1 Tax=Leptolyngbya sp. 7M TaxID=2812896 RepID=UPI001B8D4EF1|nr:hypothetical protein [Leptolyngbya sp. 7M]QYO62228.1 hypothetical protein JVX88_19180 [Leptolyngbya sp. 7M]